MSRKEVETLRRIVSLPAPAGKKPFVAAFIWKRFLPLAGLHAMLIGLIQLSQLRLDLAGILAPFAIAAGLAILLTTDVQNHRWFGPSAVLLSIAISIVSNAFVSHFLTAAIMICLAILVVHEFASRHAFWWPALYVPIVLRIYGSESDFLSFGLVAAAFAVSSFIFFRVEVWSGVFSALVGFTISAAIGLTVFEGGTSMFAALVFAFVIAAILYDVNAPQVTASNLRYFVVDGLILLLSAIGILAILLSGASDTGLVTLWGGSAALFAFLRYMSDLARPVRLCWAGVGIIAVIWANAPSLHIAIFCTILTCASLQFIALKTRSRFLSRFSSLLVLVLVWIMYEAASDKFSIYLPYLSLLSAVLVVTIVSSDGFDPGPPAWKGLIKGRHMVRVRQTFRIVEDLLSRIPFVGVLVTLPKALFSWFGYLGSGGGSSFWDDAIVLAVQILLILVVTEQLRFYASAMDWSYHAYWYARAVVWLSWGICAAVLGYLNHSTVLRGLSVIFALMPLILEVQRWVELGQLAPENTEFYAWLAFMSGASLLVIVFVERLSQVEKNVPEKGQCSENGPGGPIV